MTARLVHFVHETNLENETSDDVIPFETLCGDGLPRRLLTSTIGSATADYMDEYQGRGSGTSDIRRPSQDHLGWTYQIFIVIP